MHVLISEGVKHWCVTIVSGFGLREYISKDIFNISVRFHYLHKQVTVIKNFLTWLHEVLKITLWNCIVLIDIVITILNADFIVMFYVVVFRFYVGRYSCSREIRRDYSFLWLHPATNIPPETHLWKLTPISPYYPHRVPLHIFSSCTLTPPSCVLNYAI